jgi:hypothetical protein
MNKFFILQMCFDEGIFAQWLFNTKSEKDVWEYIIKNRSEFEPLFDFVKVDNEKNEKGYAKKLKEVNNLTIEKLKEICENSYVDGDSFPRAELNNVGLITLD